MSKARNHHYVPQHLLKNFAMDDGDQVYCLDKRANKSFLTNVRNVLAERDFHSIEIEFDGIDFIASFEETITRIENHYLPVLEKLTATESLLDLSEEEQFQLCLFTSFQHLRTKSFRDNFEKLSAQIREQIGPVTVGSVAEKQIRQMNMSETKFTHAQFIKDNVVDFAAMLAVGRDCFLMRSPDDNNFLIGDAPVTLHNDLDFGPYGNIGWRVPGIQIHVPITPKLTLVYWCSSLVDMMEDETKKTTQTLISTFPFLPKPMPAEQAHRRSEMARLNLEIGKQIRDCRKDKLVCLTPENVTFLNSLQIGASSRFIVSPTDNFELAREMINDDDRFKFAYRMGVEKPPAGKIIIPEQGDL